ncbi:MAG: glutamyl-tRNA reductase [Desulfobacteraceae bacterium]|nr:glutamyl-tRNA reductase [Desulfobacteraceae bacterium]MBC2757722.1 glutamyl-tRNA reductase [Desulfobacteraceae bacterium]
MSEIVLVGLNHKTAPVELREKLAFSTEETENALKLFRKDPHINEAMIISTCNRMEVLMVTKNQSLAIETISSFISKTTSISQKQLKPSTYIFSGEQAIQHVFRVASSLNSMMIGEPQILGQVKEAFKTAVNKKNTGLILNRLMHKAFSVAKRVRSETGIGGHAVSISFAAVELAKKIFDTLDDKTILLVGAGEMAELAVEHLIRNTSSKKLLVANRTLSVGIELADRYNGHAIRLEEIPEKLKTVDIIISSTGSPNYVITKNHVKPTMRSRKNRPLFFIDIAVPRDIDPAINRISNAYVYDIDDLQGVINENIDTRNVESIKAERIVDESVIKFTDWYKSIDVIPTIIDLRKKLNTIVDMELSKTMQTLQHLSRSDRVAFERMTESLIKKILHDPTLFLKNPGSHRNKSVYLDFTRKLFNLDS